MNKSELAAQIANRTCLSCKEAELALGAMCELVCAALAQGERVQLTGFGVFEAKERAARSGRNPKTGESVKIPASRVPSFRPGKLLKEAVEKQTRD